MSITTVNSQKGSPGRTSSRLKPRHPSSRRSPNAVRGWVQQVIKLVPTRLVLVVTLRYSAALRYPDWSHAKSLSLIGQITLVDTDRTEHQQSPSISHGNLYLACKFLALLSIAKVSGVGQHNNGDMYNK